MRPAHFFEYFEENHIILTINDLYLAQIFRFFATDKKSLEVLNFHFGRKYHFVKLRKSVLACFFAVFK